MATDGRKHRRWPPPSDPLEPRPRLRPPAPRPRLRLLAKDSKQFTRPGQLCELLPRGMPETLPVESRDAAENYQVLNLRLLSHRCCEKLMVMLQGPLTRRSPDEAMQTGLVWMCDVPCLSAVMARTITEGVQSNFQA